MTKSEQRELSSLAKYIAAGMIDTAARAASALYRSARTTKSQDEILAFSMAYKLVSNPEFNVGK